MITAEEIKSMVQSGEGYNVDFNVKVPSKIRELTLEVCAFTNSEGGYLILGIDNDGNILGIDVDNNTRSRIQDGIRDISPSIQVSQYAVLVDDKTVWVLDIPSGKDKPYVLSGAIYVLEGANAQKLTTAEEIRSFFQTSNRIYFDAVPCPRFDIHKNIDDANFKYFRQESNITGNVSTNQILSNLQVFDESGVVKNGGVLFFGQEPENTFPHAVIHCVLFKGTTKVHIIDDKVYGGTLYNQYKQSEAWIKDKLKVSYIIEGMGPRKEIWEIPLAVFKEAIINALSHRDYYEEGAVTMVEIYDNRVEISNPGGLLPAVQKEFGTRSMSRNPLIFGLFTRMDLVERVASGIPRMRDAMEEAGLPDPAFIADGGFFTVIFKRPEEVRIKDDTVNDTVNGRVDTANGRDDTVNGKDDTVNDTVNSAEEAVLEVIKKEEGLSSPLIAKAIGKSISTTKRYLGLLTKAGKIEFRGSPKTGGYYLK
jgi:ATP-dependent DNA helicase RecG